MNRKSFIKTMGAATCATIFILPHVNAETTDPRWLEVREILEKAIKETVFFQDADSYEVRQALQKRLENNLENHPLVTCLQAGLKKEGDATNIQVYFKVKESFMLDSRKPEKDSILVSECQVTYDVCLKDNQQTERSL